MHTWALVSIIVPVYNTEPYLKKCINSILNQTYHNIEIFLINDGSTDKSRSICAEYADQDKRVTLFDQDNQGLSAARNRGLEAMNGDYVCFIDSDDYIHQEMISKMMGLACAYNADMVICDYYNVGEDLEGNGTQEEYFELELSNIRALNMFNSELCMHMTIMWNKLYRSNLFKKLRFPIGKNYEDEYLCYKLIYKAEKIVYFNKKLYYHLKRDDSIMGKGFSIERIKVLDAFEERSDFFFRHGLEEIGIHTSNLYLRLIIKYYSKLHCNNQLNKELDDKLIRMFRSEYNKRRRYLRGLRMKECIYLYMFSLNPTLSRLLFSIWALVKRKINRIIKQ